MLQAGDRQAPAHGQVEFGDALTEHALAAAAVDQARALPAAVAFEQLHHLLALRQQLVAEFQQGQRLLFVRA
ncbi:hypothetical protein D3C80_2004500 [compost metagenome]